MDEGQAWSVSSLPAISSLGEKPQHKLKAAQEYINWPSIQGRSSSGVQAHACVYALCWGIFPRDYS